MMKLRLPAGDSDGYPVKIIDSCFLITQAHAELEADLAKLTSSAAKEIETTLNEMTARRKELSAKNVSRYR